MRRVQLELLGLLEPLVLRALLVRQARRVRRVQLELLVLLALQEPLVLQVQPLQAHQE